MLKNILLSLLGLVVIVGAGALWYINQPQFGYEPTGARLERIKKSPNYKDGEFQNLEPITVMTEVPEAERESAFESYSKWIFGDNSALFPQEPLPSIKTDLKALDPSENIVVWMGHSSYYLQMDGVKILVDPVLSGYAAPLPFKNFKEYAGADIYKAEDMPEVDVLVISHNHWDHLDYDVAMAIKDKVKHVVLPLGLGEYFERWGYDVSKLHETDWNESTAIDGKITITTLPAQHYTSRLLKRNDTQWASFAFVTPQHKIYYSGDSGYGQHFKAIGERFGGFDFALIENGQYNKRWAKIHMHPEESAQTAVDVKTKIFMPVHNSKFTLGRHTWQTPMRDLVKASEGKPYELWTPIIGQKVEWDKPAQTFPHWWETVK